MWTDGWMDEGRGWMAEMGGYVLHACNITRSTSDDDDGCNTYLARTDTDTATDEIMYG